MAFLRAIFSVDLRSLALFRVTLGFIILKDLFERAGDLVAHYTDFGVLPRGVFLDRFANSWHFSLNFIGGTAGIQTILFGLAILVTLLFILGFRTRLMTFFCWLFVVSLQTRNPLLLHGGDTVIRMLLFWSLFLPLGAYYSMDSALDSKEEKRPILFGSVGSFALYFQFLALYWFSVVHKSGKEWWEEGTAVYYALNVDHFTTGLGFFVLNHFPPELLKFLTYATLFIETIGAGLILVTPVTSLSRLIVPLMFIGLHTGFRSTMELGTFPLVSSAFMLAFLPTRLWEVLEQKWGNLKKRQLAIFYDGECNFCKKMVFILRTFLLLPWTTIQTAQSKPQTKVLMEKHNSWVLLDEDKNPHLKFSAVTILFLRSPLFWPLGKIMQGRLFQKWGNWAYEWVANHRQASAQIVKWAKFRPLNIQVSWFNHLVALFFILYVFLWNMNDLPNSPLKMDRRLLSIGNCFRVEQMWDMFSPYPAKNDGWFMVPGVLKDGSEIDLLTGKPPTYEKPQRVSATYKNAHWSKYLRRLESRDNVDYRLYYGKYLCRSWNAKHSGDKQLSTFQFIFMEEFTQPDFRPMEIKKVVLWNHNCFL